MRKKEITITPEHDTVDRALKFTLRSLSAKDQGVSKIREKLTGRGYSLHVIDQVVQICREYGYLNDTRLADHVATRLLETGRGSGQYVAQKLMKLGVGRDEIKRAIEASEAEVDTTAALIEQMGRKFPSFGPDCRDQKLIARIYSHFMRRGYRYGDVRDAMNGCLNRPLPDQDSQEVFDDY